MTQTCWHWLLGAYRFWAAPSANLIWGLYTFVDFAERSLWFLNVPVTFQAAAQSTIAVRSGGSPVPGVLFRVWSASTLQMAAGGPANFVIFATDAIWGQL